MNPPIRSASQRRQDALRRLEHDIDAWIATADGMTPFLAPLSFLWDGTTLLISVPAASPTARNLLASRKVRIAIGVTRDVVLITGEATAIAAAEIGEEVGDAFAAKCNFDPRGFATPFLYFRIVPSRLQAWREVEELDGRDLMRDGAWLVDE